MLDGIAFLLALFTCVVLHELVIRWQPENTAFRQKDITLLPIGGVARLEKMPENPKQELWVALAGPAVNAVIAVILLGALVLSGTFEPIRLTTYGDRSFLERLLVVNITLILFNLIPAFPMDGGRVVRAILASRMEYTQATQIAATLGKGIALIFGFIGLFSNPFLIFIALFVWIGAGQEASMVRMKSTLANHGRPGDADRFQSSFTHSLAVAIR